MTRKNLDNTSVINYKSATDLPRATQNTEPLSADALIYELFKNCMTYMWGERVNELSLVLGLNKKIP